MKKFVVFLTLALLVFFSGCAQGEADSKAKVLIMISEQNIEGPRVEWWLSEVDLSVTESIVAQSLINAGYEIIDNSVVNKIIKRKPAFRKVELSKEDSVNLGKSSNVEYVILGKAIASSEGNVPDSNMVSCHATITGKIIRISDSKVIAYLDGKGASAHMDSIAGGSEALAKAANYVAIRVINTLDKKGGSK